MKHVSSAGRPRVAYGLRAWGVLGYLMHDDGLIDAYRMDTLQMRLVAELPIGYEVRTPARFVPRPTT